MVFHLVQIINLGETILPCMDIEVLREEWFYDDITPKGLSFDGFLDQASKTPLGNTKDFELIHSPTAMANFQCNFWYNKNPCIGKTLFDTVKKTNGCIPICHTERHYPNILLMLL